MKRRNFDSEMKLAVVLEGLKGESSISDICRRYQISESLYYKWRDKFLEGGRKALVKGQDSSDVQALRSKISELERIIGKQAIKIEILKKIESYQKDGLR